MNQTTDVAIIGGGVTGCAADYYLSEIGVSCTIVDSTDLASYASGYAAGGLNPLEGYEIPGLLSEFAMKAYLMHLDLWDRLQSATGINYHGRVLDLIKVCYDDTGLVALEKNKDIFQRTSAVSYTLLTPPTKAYV